MKHKLLESLLTVVLGAGGVATSTFAATNTYLIIPGIPGESFEARYRDWIVLDTFSVSVVERACAGFTVMKQLDTSSPILSASALTGVVYPSMTLHSVKAGEGQIRFLVFELAAVVVIWQRPSPWRMCLKLQGVTGGGTWVRFDVIANSSIGTYKSNCSR